ncbi:glycosyltransferase family 4 protein [uncultured Alistipes sp.]|uniref:glycosyltransferase family 4 protein n=1 Tax=uncultured Alistipes sp. TaxID=538949 RepID=UPI002608EBFC|nr:glycosyltransferase family 4 protein [uncultured Alistipes sp.]
MIPGNNVLTVGPDYRFPNGGIAKLLETYSTMFDRFRFVATMRAPAVGKESKLRTFGRLVAALASFHRHVLFSPVRIVHIHTASGITFFRESIFLWLARLYGRKVVLHCHSGSLKEFYEAHPAYVGRCFRSAARVVVIARPWELYLRGRGHDNVVTIGNPIPRPAPFEKGEHRPLNLLFLGLLCDNKGIWDILDVICRHRAELGPHVRLLVGGNGEVERFRARVEELGIADLVTYCGWVDGERKRRLLEQADIYLQPSYREALGIAILEAMSYRTPVVATATGGIPEIVRDGVNGLLVAPGDREALYRAIAGLAGSPERRREMGDRGARIARTYYPEAIRIRLEDLYQSLS